MYTQEELKNITLKISLRDQKAFKHLFEYFFNDLVNYAYSFVSDRRISEDIVLELMVKIWDLEQRISDINNIKYYLYRSTKNRAINHIKKNAKFSLKELNDASVDHTTPESLLISKERTTYIQDTIDNLPLRCRTVFILIRENKMSYQEVADILEISINTVNRHMQEAMHRLYKQLVE